MKVFASTQDQVLTQPKLPAMLSQGAAIDQFGAGLGQRTFANVGKGLVKLAGQDKLQYGVAKEFEPLVSLKWRTLLVGH